MADKDKLFLPPVEDQYAHALAVSAALQRGEEPPVRAAVPQPPPAPGRLTILPLVLADLQARAEAGKAKYGTLLESHNGRDTLMDAYQEACDLVMYLRQAIAERDGK